MPDLSIVDCQRVLIAYRFVLKPATYGTNGFGCLIGSVLLNKVGRQIRINQWELSYRQSPGGFPIIWKFIQLHFDMAINETKEIL